MRDACEYCNRDDVVLYGWHADAWCGSCMVLIGHHPGGILDDVPIGRPPLATYDQPFVLQTPDGAVMGGVVQ